MQIGMIGLGRMGGNMVRRLLRAGHECVVYDIHPDSIAALEAEGAKGADSLAALMAPDDIIIDGGNSPYREAVDANERLKASGIHYVDVGTSGGVWGWSAATA